MKINKKTLLAAWSKGWVKALLIIVVVLLIIRIILSPVATKVANDYLATSLPGYNGHVDCIHFAFLRGAYTVEGMYLDKVDSLTLRQTEFVSVKMIDLSLEWAALFQGRIVGELVFDEPVVNFTKDKVEPSDVAEDTATFRQLLDVGMPLDINRFEILGGEVHYKDPNSSPVVDIFMHDINVLAQNLQNTVDPGQVLPSSVEVNANVYSGNIDIDIHLDLLAENPTFDLKAECRHLQLPELNNFFKAYGKFTVEKGDFSVFSEVAAKDGGFKGYVKPLMVELRILGPDDKDENVLVLLWEGVIDAVNWVFKNKKEDQLATKMPLEGQFANPRADIIFTIYELLKNGFIQALNPSLDYEININSVNEADTRGKGEKNKVKREERKENRIIAKEEKKAKKEQAKEKN